MKTKLFISLILCSFLLCTCAKENHSAPDRENAPDGEIVENLILETEGNTLKGPLNYSKLIVNRFASLTDSYFSTTKIDYNDDQLIEHVSYFNSDSNSSNYDLSYEDGQLVQIDRTSYFNFTGETTNTTYNVIYNGDNEILLLQADDENSGSKYNFTDGYIDSIIFFRADNLLTVEIFFERDQNNNIEMVSIYNIHSTHTAKTEYHFTEHDPSSEVLDAFNPAYSHNIISGSRMRSSFFNLKISNHPPTKTTIIDSDGIGWTDEFWSEITMAADGRTLQVNGSPSIFYFEYE